MKTCVLRSWIFCVFAVTTSAAGGAELPARAAYVTNYGDDTVSIVSLDARAVVATIDVGDRPMGVAVTPDGLLAYVANSGDNSVSVLDAVSGSVIDTITEGIGVSPSHLAVSRDGERVYVTNNGSASISVIDTKTNVVVDTASTPPLPWSVAIHPVRDELWLGCSSPEVLEVRSTTDLSVLARVAPTNQLHYASSDLAFRADGSEAFGAESCGECGRFHRISGTPSSGTVEILQSNITWYNPPGAAYTAAVHPTSGVAYLGKAGSVSNNHESPKIFEFADGAVRRMLTFTGRDYTPRAMEVAPDDGLLWVAQGWDQGFLSVVDPATMLAITTVEVGGNPQGLALTTQRTLFLPGDLNGDGRVGSEDLDIVRANWGAGVDAGCLSCGDPSGDGIVGSADLDLVRSNWGRTLRTAVPEPGTVVLGFVGAIALLRRRNASRRHPRDRINPNRIPPDGV